MIKQRIRSWLDIKDPDEKLQKEVDKLLSDLAFWKRQFKKQQPTKKCTKCKQPIDLWPFNDKLGYYIKGNRVTHQNCPEQSLTDSTGGEDD